MDSDAILQEYKELAEKLGITVAERSLKGAAFPAKSGYCTVKGQKMLIVDKNISKPKKIRVFTEALAQFSTDEIFVIPAIRKLLTDFAKKHKKQLVSQQQEDPKPTSLDSDPENTPPKEESPDQ